MLCSFAVPSYRPAPQLSAVSVHCGAEAYELKPAQGLRWKTSIAGTGHSKWVLNPKAERSQHTKGKDRQQLPG